MQTAPLPSSNARAAERASSVFHSCAEGTIHSRGKHIKCTEVGLYMQRRARAVHHQRGRNREPSRTIIPVWKNSGVASLCRQPSVRASLLTGAPAPAAQLRRQRGELGTAGCRPSAGSRQQAAAQGADGRRRDRRDCRANAMPAALQHRRNSLAPCPCLLHGVPAATQRSVPFPANSYSPSQLPVPWPAPPCA